MLKLLHIFSKLKKKKLECKHPAFTLHICKNYYSSLNLRQSDIVFNDVYKYLLFIGILPILHLIHGYEKTFSGF